MCGVEETTMKIVFGFAETFRHCSQTESCGKGFIRHKVGQLENAETKQIEKVYMCFRCFTITNGEDKKHEPVAASEG